MGHPVTIVAVVPQGTASGCGGANSTVPRSLEQFTSGVRTDDESMTKLRTHKIVQDRVYCRIQVHHDPTEVEDIVILFNTYAYNVLFGCYNYPKNENSERDQA